MNVALPPGGFAEYAFGSPAKSAADRATLLRLKSILEKKLAGPYAPPEPGFTVTAQTVNSGFRLEWAPVPGAKRYLVYRGTTTTFSATTTQLIGSTDEQLTVGTRAYIDVTDQFAVATYPNLYYWVRAVDDVDEGPISALATVTNSGMTTTSLQTSTSNPKVVITSANGIQIYDDAGNVVAQFNNNTLNLDGNNATLTVSGGTITGSTLKTAASGQRVEIDSSNGVRIYDSGGNLTAQFNGTTLTLNSSSATITGATFKTATSGERIEIDSTNGIRSYDSGGDLIAQFKGTDGNIIDGTYTPTLTGVTNIDSVTADVCHYLRIHDVVLVTGTAGVDVTSSGAFVFRVSLPFSSSFTNFYDCSGVVSVDTANLHAAMIADTVNDEARVTGTTTDINNQAIYFSFTYKIM